MLHVNTEARYTAAQILSHPWVSVSKLHLLVSNLILHL